jgi:hypothetical protein
VNADNDTIPASEAMRSIEWLMQRLSVVRAERDTARALVQKSLDAMHEYAVSTHAILGRSRWADANARRSAIAAEHRARARAYRDAGMPLAQIGLKMGREDGRAHKYGENGVAYSVTTVKRWIDGESLHRSSK